MDALNQCSYWQICWYSSLSRLNCDKICTGPGNGFCGLICWRDVDWGPLGLFPDSQNGHRKVWSRKGNYLWAVQPNASGSGLDNRTGKGGKDGWSM